MDYFVIGEREIVLAFKLVGVDGKVALNYQSALDAFNEGTGQSDFSAAGNEMRPKVLILTEDVSDMLEQQVRAWQMKGESPLIVEIPPLSGHIQGRKTLTDSIREAVGIQL